LSYPGTAVDLAPVLKDCKTSPALPFPVSAISGTFQQSAESIMGIDTERDIEANLQIGPTDAGMVRLFIEAQGVEIPMDFTPDEAAEIAEEIMAAARRAGGGKGKR